MTLSQLMTHASERPSSVPRSPKPPRARALPGVQWLRSHRGRVGGEQLPVRPFSVLRAPVSGDVEEAAQGFADHIAGGGVVCTGACFDCGTQFGVEAYWDDFGRC